MLESYVCKFGGTSLATREAVNQVRKIIEDNDQRQYIVVSAPGSREAGDPKVTTLLKDLAAKKNEGMTGTAAETIDAIAQRYDNIYGGSRETVREEIQQRFQANLPDDAHYANLLAAGEYWQARLFAEEIGAEFIDPQDHIKLTGSVKNGQVLPVTYKLLAELAQKPGRKVIAGFYGATEDGRIALLRDGGSDRTGSIVAVGISAAVYENFSDGPVYAASPKLIKNPQVIPEMTRKELRDLAYSGFEIFQQEAILPLEESSIVLHIRGTRDYPQQGTFVVEDRISDPNSPIIGIAYKPGFCAFSIEKAGINDAVGVLTNMLNIFSKRGIPVEFPPSGIDDISIVVEQEHVVKQISTIKFELADLVNQALPNGRKCIAEFTENLGALVVAGKGIKTSRHTEARILSILADEGIDVIADSKGVKRRCLIYVIPQKQGQKAVEALYNAVIK